MTITRLARGHGNFNNLRASILFFLEGRVQEQADYLEALRQLLPNPAQRTEMQQRSRQRILQHFTLGAMANTVAASLEQACTHRPPRPAFPQKLLEAFLVEATEHSHAQHQLETQAEALKAHFQHRLTQRDRTIASLEEKLASAKTMPDSNTKRNSWSWKRSVQTRRLSSGNDSA